MQLLVLALMLLMSGKNSNLNQLKPILEEFGGGEAAQAFKQAEELSGVISAVQSLTATSQPPAPSANDVHVGDERVGEGFPLAPIANIADERITYCLSRYIALGE